MSRLPSLSFEQLSPEQKRVHELIASGPRGGVRGPLAVWLHRPKLAETAQALGQYCRYDSSLPPRLSELAILVIATFWKSEFEWWAHEPLARQAGVSDEVIAALRAGTSVPFVQEDESIVYEVVHGLLTQKILDDELYHRANAILGTDRVVDLVGLTGYYTLISLTINAFEVEVPNHGANGAK